MKSCLHTANKVVGKWVNFNDTSEFPLITKEVFVCWEHDVTNRNFREGILPLGASVMSRKIFVAPARLK